MIEIGLFITVGGQIGVALTLAMIIVTSIVGSILLRVQGVAVLNQLRSEIETKGTPGKPMIHGFMIMVAGVLLLVPGFLTDTIGFLLFIPPVRNFLWTLIGKDIVVKPQAASQGGYARDWEGARSSNAGSSQGGSRTIDLDEAEFERKDTAAPGGKSDSPWSKP